MGVVHQSAEKIPAGKKTKAIEGKKTPKKKEEEDPEKKEG
jgi:hypothetical protein